MLSTYDFYVDLKNVTFLYSLKRKQPYTQLPTYDPANKRDHLEVKKYS